VEQNPQPKLIREAMAELVCLVQFQPLAAAELVDIPRHQLVMVEQVEPAAAAIIQRKPLEVEQQMKDSTEAKPQLQQMITLAEQVAEPEQ
jgi:hypothetical protein